jgi:serine/threonine protein kinase
MKLLASGGFGDVVHVRDRKSGMDMAIKLARLEAIKSELRILLKIRRQDCLQK